MENKIKYKLKLNKQKKCNKNKNFCANRYCKKATTRLSSTSTGKHWDYVPHIKKLRILEH